MVITVGILALQGNFQQHEIMLKSLGVNSIYVRYPNDLDRCEGLIIPGGSDCPIEKGNPILEFFSAVTRKNPNKTRNKSWQTQEKVSRINALKMLTTWAAYGEFDEHRRGIIQKGFDADLTVLSQDITNCREEDILKTEVLMTFVGGELVYKK